ncbi:MAG TPA: hypothetical protein VF781_10285 [Solirubrobacteraceae bacterium]
MPPSALGPPPRCARAALLILTLCTLAGAFLLTAAEGAPARTRSANHARLAGTSPGFVGVDIDGPLLDPSNSLDLNQQMSSMVSNGVQSVRAAFNWAAAQPYASWSQVPADRRSQFVAGPAGRPISYAATDQIVGDAADHGLSVLPTLLYVPAWDAAGNRSGFKVPQRDAPYAEFAAAMVRRYGTRGSFWSMNPRIPKLPVSQWQVWNEPNIPAYWPQPFAQRYVALLRLASRAIRQADPGARVVLGALTNLAWHALGRIYAIRGARGLFDSVSVNGFTSTPANVILYLRLMRRAMNRYGDAAKPLIASELSWPSAIGQTTQHHDFNVTQSGQARNVAELLRLIGSWRGQLGLSAFYYYTWMGNEFRGAPAFSFSGLLRYTGRGRVQTKPALAAFRNGALWLEGCRAKGKTANRCLH